MIENPSDQDFLDNGISPEFAKAMNIEGMETGIFMGIPEISTTNNDGSVSLYKDSENNTPNDIVKEEA